MRLFQIRPTIVQGNYNRIENSRIRNSEIDFVLVHEKIFIEVGKSCCSPEDLGKYQSFCLLLHVEVYPPHLSS